jgi:hypothetical protein
MRAAFKLVMAWSGYGGHARYLVSFEKGGITGHDD